MRSSGKVPLLAATEAGQRISSNSERHEVSTRVNSGGLCKVPDRRRGRCGSLREAGIYSSHLTPHTSPARGVTR